MSMDMVRLKQPLKSFADLASLPIVEANNLVETETIDFASRKWDYEKMIAVLRHHRDRDEEQRAMTIVASDFLAVYSYLAETYTVDQADRILHEALQTASTKYRNALDLSETKL